jgi:hypothetical protein
MRAEHYLFITTDVTAAISADIQVTLREQGVQVTAFSGVGAVTRAFLAQVRQEVVAVARVRPIVLPADVILTIRVQHDRFPPAAPMRRSAIC